MAFILVVDDNLGIRTSLEDYLKSENHEVITAATGEAALKTVTKETPDIILLDLNLPDLDGLEVLKQVKNKYNNIEVVIITGYAEISTAVRAIKLGARDYIKKPFDLAEIDLIIQKVEKANQLDDQIAYLEDKKRDQSRFSDIVGTSEPMQEVYAFIRQVANSSKTTVMVGGGNRNRKRTSCQSYSRQ